MTPVLALGPASTVLSKPLNAVNPLRGVACLCVVLHHTFGYQSLSDGHTSIPSGFWHWPAAALSAFSSVAWSVNFFVVLSGFCLFTPLIIRAPLPNIRLDLAQFARRRLRRILPPYYAALILLALLEILVYRKASGGWSWHAAFSSRLDILLHVLMLHNCSAATIASVSPAFWSLALECQLYVLFPALIWIAARFGFKPLLALTLIIAVLWSFSCWHRLGASQRWTPLFAVYYDALPGRAFEFAAGMAAAAFAARPHPKQNAVAWALLLLSFPLALYGVVKISRFAPLSDPLWGMTFAALLVLLCRVPKSTISGHLLLRGLTRLGAVSYSVYLIHHPLIWILTPVRLHCPGTPLGYYEAGLLRLPILLGLGYLFHLAFERPFLSGKAQGERKAELAAAVSPAP